MKWRFYERVITSRTQARDLLWNFDTLRRLNDAQSEGSVKNTASYIDPGILWWVFDPESAKLRGQKDACRIEAPAKDPGVGPEGGGAVLLLDEIDKADPDVPNNLLVPLGSFQFTVAESGAETVTEVAATRPLLVLITTNDERVLPNAFMRRCVVLELDPPNEERLIKIAEAHYGLDLTNIYRTIARRVIEMSPGSNAAAQMLSGRAVEAEPSTAEYLDTVGACLELDVTIEKDKAAWDAIFQATLLKRSNTPGL
jgi:MoxR-like ATPase